MTVLSNHQNSQLKMPSTQIVSTGTVEDDTNAVYVPHGRSHYKPTTKSTEDGGVVKSFAKRPVKLTQKELIDMVSTKGNEKLLNLWSGKVTPNNVMRLTGKEGEYLYCVFEVDGFPDQNKKAIPLPVEVAEKLAKKAHAMAKDDPSKYGLKLTHSDETVRARHQERLDALKWVGTDCSRPDKEGKQKPCVLNPKESEGWVLCPAKLVPKCSLSEMAPKSSKVGNKRAAEAPPCPDFMTMVDKPLPNVKRMICIKYGERVAIDMLTNGYLTITEYMTPPNVAAADEQAAAEDAHDDDDDEE